MTLSSVPHVVIVAAAFLIFLGVPLSLYAVFTRGQRRTTREIRTAAREHGWTWRRMRWTGDPTSFRINGQAATGEQWIMTSSQAGTDNQGWTVRLAIRFPALGGIQDFALEPRDSGPSATTIASAITPSLESSMARFSPMLAGKAEFFRDAREMPTGSAPFDAAYRVLTRPDLPRSPLTPALAARMLAWPATAVQPHSVMAWRDAAGFAFQARLPRSPNWPAVSHVISVAEELASRMPPPTSSPPPSTFVDRVAAGLRISL